MNGLKTAMILTALLGLSACGDTNFNYSEICVDGVVYLRSPNGNLTPKINAEFYPYTCVNKGANNG